ncbi:MAG: DUF4406 domain-containing protein [Muribaculaceae bacterium]|nr:DUF4406 domain-containing protein [Muribaculaceae bacterium]
MKLYISIPITGRPIQDARNHADAIKAKLEQHGHKCITPFDVCPESDHSYAYYMGRDIEALLSDDIDGVFFGDGFQNSKGCRLEHAAAKFCGKHIVYPSTSHMHGNDTLTVRFWMSLRR